MSETQNIAAQPAQVAGYASVVRAKPAIFTAEIQVVRAATGKTETYTVTGTPEEPETQGN